MQNLHFYFNSILTLSISLPSNERFIKAPIASYHYLPPFTSHGVHHPATIPPWNTMIDRLQHYCSQHHLQWWMTHHPLTTPQTCPNPAPSENISLNSLLLIYSYPLASCADLLLAVWQTSAWHICSILRQQQQQKQYLTAHRLKKPWLSNVTPSNSSTQTSHTFVTIDFHMPLTTRTLKQIDHLPNNTHPVCLPHSIFPTFKLQLLPCTIRSSPISHIDTTLLMTHCIPSPATCMVPLGHIPFTFGKHDLRPLVWHSMSLAQTVSPIQLKSPHSKLHICL